MTKHRIDPQEIEKILDTLYSMPSDSLENETVEFKQFQNENSLYNSKDLAEEICALANNAGGIIILGVVDSSNINNCMWEEQLVGFEVTDIAELKSRLCGKIDPYIDVYIDYINYAFKTYTIIHVPAIQNTLVATKSGKVYIREGKQSRPMSSYEIENKIKSLQTYDWSSEIINIDPAISLDNDSLQDAKAEYCGKKNITPSTLNDTTFLEAIGVTRNGKLTNGGLVLLGKQEIIEDILGSYEYRFTRKSRTGALLCNDIFHTCIWRSILNLKSMFNEYNNEIQIEFQSAIYTAPLLDEIAFHEACLNAIVHRDYTVDGMVTINFLDDKMVISNPGTFYGGVTEDNIAYHEPRHRNKNLANMLMIFQLVDRAGMGVFRMGLRSLMYGRSFPKFNQGDGCISVSMQTEYTHPEVFVIAMKYLPKLGIPELLLLNLINQYGYISTTELEERLSKISQQPWELIVYSIEKSVLKDYLVIVGNQKGIYITPNKYFADYFKCKKRIKASSNSDKHIKIYKHLKDIGEDSNENLKQILCFKHASSMSNFLKDVEYLKSKGKGINRRWFLKK